MAAGTYKAYIPYPPFLKPYTYFAMDHVTAVVFSD